MSPQPVPTSQLALRAVAFLGPLVALLATGPAGHWPPWWFLLLVVVLAAAGAAAPDSPIAVGAGLATLIWWAAVLDDELPGEVVVAAVALFAGHLAALLAAYGPRTMPLDAPTVLLWLRRAALVLLTVPATWLIARALQGEPEQAGIWVAGVAVACAAIIVATVALGVEEDR